MATANPNFNTIGLDFTTCHPSYQAVREQYDILEDVMAGEQAVKTKRTKYLPMPNPTDQSAANLVRYEQYLTRAIFPNITRRMARTLVGLGFLREPKVELPPKLMALEDDCDGSGLSLVQFAKKMALETIVYGRCAVLIDYPSRRLAMSKMFDSSRVRPYFDFYKASEITNWYEQGYRLQFVTLTREVELLQSYVVRYEPCWRLLEMRGGNRADFSSGGRFVSRINTQSDGQSTVIPVDAMGNPFDHITLQICGAFTNSWEIRDNDAPLYPVATLNLGLFRNIADAEEIAFVAGQPQIFVTGLDNTQVRQNDDQEVLVGARVGISLGPNGKAMMLQANANNAPRELALDKVEMMQQLGVQLAVGSTNMMTATEVVTESLIRNSVLTSVLQNVGVALTNALKDACMYVGEDPESVMFEVDTSVELTEEQATQAVSESITRGESMGSAA